jgi:hypothetical protein
MMTSSSRVLDAGYMPIWYERGANSPSVHGPICYGLNTHLVGVEHRASLGRPMTVQFAHSEDDPDVRVVTRSGALFSGVGPLGSPRRGSLTVVFECEQSHRFGVTYAQHKGEEFVRVIDLGDI